VPFAVELVVPGEVIVLQVVVGILAVIDAVRTTVKIVVVVEVAKKPVLAHGVNPKK
jgi:hypothetical protein